ncbi:MAG TPA: hypothetical protein VFI25_11290 [Planctomycetota bacterium]|nr:hypothetical protein [Planctomycetota bacterium]
MIPAVELAVLTLRGEAVRLYPDLHDECPGAALLAAVARCDRERAARERVASDPDLTGELRRAGGPGLVRRLLDHPLDALAEARRLVRP